MKKNKLFLLILLVVLSSSCLKLGFSKEESWQDLEEENQQLYMLNEFGRNMMSTYYLWNKEIDTGLNSWQYSDDPVQKVRDIRYKDPEGNDIDKWTVMTDDYAGFLGMVDGNTKSNGLDFQIYYANRESDDLVVVVTFTYPDSPAAKAGLKRGDVIVALNGSTMNVGNYKTLISNTLLSDNTVALTMDTGEEISLTPIRMQLNPIICNKVIEYGGRRIGYLHYSSFTLNSCRGLVDVFRSFKDAGVSEIVLDLRYNSGGYSLTSELLASMIVPVNELDRGSVYLKDIYNTKLAEAWGDKEFIFKTEFQINEDDEEYTVSTAGSNPNVTKLHVLITGDSASASESIICGLMPYMTVNKVGERTSGKFCGGFIVDGPTFYGWVKDEISNSHYNTGVELTDNWGIYVMVSRYADKNGNTASMPDGIAPDMKVADNPLDGYQLGDPNETMLAVALSGMASDSTPKRAGLSCAPIKAEYQPQRPSVRLITPSSFK